MDIARRTLLAAAALPFAARAWAQGQGPLRIGLSAPNTTIDPHLQSNVPNNAVNSHIFDALVTNDEQSASKPGLATSWRVLDDTHWEFTLREGVMFSDGSQFTAADAIASIQRANDLPSTASFRTYTRAVKAMSAPTPGTLLIETARPDPLLPNSMSRIRIISAKYKDAATADFNNGTAAIGTGPYTFREFVPGSHVALARNDAWWGGKLPFAEVRLRILTESGSRLAALLAGDLDLIEDVPAQGAARVTANPDLQLIKGLSSRLIYLTMDADRDVSPFVTTKDGSPLGHNPLKKLKVRQALDMAINRAAIVERVMDGNAVAACQFLPTGGPGTAPGFAVTPFDAGRARALLAEAGYPQGFGLTIHGPNNRYVNDGKVLQAIGQMFTRIGIDTKVETVPWTVYVGRSAKHEFSVNLIGWGVNTGETSNPLSAIVATIDKEAGLGVANDGHYSNPAVDGLIKQALRTMDEAARNDVLAKASALAFGDLAILPLHHEVGTWGLRTPLTYATRADQYTLAQGVGTRS